MTKQTLHPLEPIQLNNTTRPAYNLVELYQRGVVLLDAEYQRGSVWDEDQQIELIHSFLEGLPTGNITINDRLNSAWGDGSPYLFSVIDGKQRLLALTRWFSGELLVPSSWFSPEYLNPGAGTKTPDGLYVSFLDLQEIPQRKINNRFTVNVSEANVRSLAEEAEIFVRLNNGGTIQLAETIVAAQKMSRPRTL